MPTDQFRGRDVILMQHVAVTVTVADQQETAAVIEKAVSGDQSLTEEKAILPQGEEKTEETTTAQLVLQRSARVILARFPEKTPKTDRSAQPEEKVTVRSTAMTAAETETAAVLSTAMTARPVARAQTAMSAPVEVAALKEPLKASARVRNGVEDQQMKPRTRLSTT